MLDENAIPAVVPAPTSPVPPLKPPVAVKVSKPPVNLLRQFIAYVLLSLFGITMLVPFLWMVSTSLKDPGAVFNFPPEWIPGQTKYYFEDGGQRYQVRLIGEAKGDFAKVKFLEGPQKELYSEVPSHALKREWKLKIEWANYPRAWKAIPFARGYINSLFVTICVTLGQVVTSSMAAYAFARLHFPGRDKLFMAYLSTLMIPGVVTLIPVFILLKMMPELLNSLFHTTWWTSDLFIGKHYVGKPLGIDSYFALIMPGLFSAYGTFMLRQFFMSIPEDLEDAAKIDGCSLFGIYYRIILPLSKPALATLITFTFMGQWKNFMWPLIVANSEEMMPLPVLLASFKGLYSTDWTLLMAGALIILAPMIIVFIACQKYFVEGIQLGALKG